MSARKYEYNRNGLATLYVYAHYEESKPVEHGDGSYDRDIELTDVEAAYGGYDENDEMIALDHIFVRPHGKKELVSVADDIKAFCIEQLGEWR